MKSIIPLLFVTTLAITSASFFRDFNDNSYEVKSETERRFTPRDYGARKAEDARRRRKRKSSETDSSSSSLELPKWKDEWRNIWLGKKIEAMNMTTPRGDVVNMVAARPWGVQCGDPNQHDMPWGSCMLSMECEPEYRIYRGDYFCGRTEFVCCALQLTSYDLNQGFDPSFEDTSLETDSAEKRNREKDSRQQNARAKARAKREREKLRRRRKRKIRKTIRKIIREVKKLLRKAHRNSTIKRIKKTKQLKQFVKELKKKYKKDRVSVRDIHDLEMIKIDEALLRKLYEMRGLNNKYMLNRTFRHWLRNKTLPKGLALQLEKDYPTLRGMFHYRRSAGPEAVDDDDDDDDGDGDLNYDVEYGFVYY